MNHVITLTLALGGAIGLCSCNVPLASSDQNCVSYCALLQGCGAAGAPSGDCNAWCSAYEPVVESTGCKPLFDESLQCIVAEGTCQGASCTAQTQSYLDCVHQFCASKPTDPACPQS